MVINVLQDILQPVGYKATDGTLYPSAGLALLHDFVERHWQRLLPTLQDGQVVLQTRRKLRVSQSALAREARISQPMLALIESGRRRITEMVMHRIWAALWRLHKEYETPPALEMLIRLEQDVDGGMVGVASTRERIEVS